MPLSRSIFWAMNTFDQIIEQQKYHLCCPPTYFFSHSAINRPSNHANNRPTVKYFTSFQCFLAVVAFFYRASTDPMMAEGVRSTLTITPAAAAPSVEVNNNDNDWMLFEWLGCDGLWDANDGWWPDSWCQTKVNNLTVELCELNAHVAVSSGRKGRLAGLLLFSNCGAYFLDDFLNGRMLSQDGSWALGAAGTLQSQN